MSADDLAAAIRSAVQAVLDAAGDGWSVAQFVLCLGLERVDSNGELESTPWVWTPPHQPDWMSDGLIEAAMELRQRAGEDID